MQDACITFNTVCSCVLGNAHAKQSGGKCASTKMVLINSVLTCVYLTQTTATNVSFKMEREREREREREKRGEVWLIT